jgi:hypothetical protein
VSGELFRARTLAWLLGGGALSLCAAVLLLVFGDDLAGPPRTAGANAYSRSAIGHRGFVETLRRTGVPVVVSQGSSGAKAARGGLLIVLEPSSVDDVLAQLATMLDEVDTAVVVLPKRTGESERTAPEHLASAELVAEADAEKVLDAVAGYDVGAAFDADEDGTPEAYDDGAPDGDALIRSDAACTDRLERPVFGDAEIRLGQPQLFRKTRLETDMDCGDHAAVALFERESGTSVYVVSDPDLVANHGLGDAGNALLAVGFIESLREGGGVVIDEALHGFRGDDSVWRSLFEFPLILATLQALLALAALLLATAVRFGAPLPAAPPLAAGKRFLIDNIASLLHFGGHAGHTLVRYLDTTVRAVGRGLHAPPDLDDVGLRVWLARHGEARAVTIRLADLEAEVTAAAAARRRHLAKVALAAERVHRWKQEMLRGAVPDRDRH